MLKVEPLYNDKEILYNITQILDKCTDKDLYTLFESIDVSSKIVSDTMLKPIINQEVSDIVRSAYLFFLWSNLVNRLTASKFSNKVFTIINNSKYNSHLKLKATTPLRVMYSDFKRYLSEGYLLNHILHNQPTDLYINCKIDLDRDSILDKVYTAKATDAVELYYMLNSYSKYYIDYSLVMPVVSVIKRGR